MKVVNQIFVLKSRNSRLLPFNLFKSTLFGALLLFLLGNAHAQCTLIDDDFATDPPLANSNTDGAWYPDRYLPAAFVSDAGRLKISISAADGAQLRPSGFGGAFYNTQGRKFNQCGKCVTVAKAKLYIPADWATKFRRSDLWATAFNASDAVSFYPIFGFRNVTGSSPNISYYNGSAWVELGPPSSYDAWHDFEFRLSGSNVEYWLDGSLVGTVASNSSTYFGDIIMQAYNFNDNTLGVSYDNSANNSYDAFWDDLATTGTNGNLITNTTTGIKYCSLQGAIDDPLTLAGHTLLLADGTYSMTTSVTANKAVSIVGPNASISPVTGTRVAEAVLDFTNNNPTPGHITVNAAGAVNIKGLTILDNREGVTNSQRFGIYAPSSQGHLIQNNIFSRITTTNAGSGDEPRAVHLGIYSGGTGATVDNNLFTGTPTGVFNNRSWRRGIWSDGGAPITLTNNKFENIRSAINVENNPDDYTISGNRFDSDNGTALSFGVYNNSDLNYTLGANSFNSALYTLINLSSGPVGYVIDATACNLSGTAFPSLAIADLFNVERLTVHGTNSGRNGRVITKSGNVYIVPTAYGGAAKGSIQRGVNIASTGDVINVKDGTYTENVTVNKSITLISADGAAATIIDGNSASGELGTIFFPNGSTNATVGQIGKGFHIKGLDNASPGIEKAGVYLQGTQSNITIEGNIIEARGDAAMTGEYNASNNNIVINANQLTGVTFTGANPATGDQFSVPNVARQAAVFGGGAGTTNTMNFTFTNNTIATNAAGTSAGNMLVTLDLVGTNDISNNFFTGHTLAAALRVRGSGTYTINENSFAATYTTAILRQGASVNAECNWFGSSNGSTVATKISGTVDYQPFLSSGTDSDLVTAGFQPASGSCSCAGTLTTTLTPNHVTCFGNSNGTIFNAPTGGTAPYTYSWNTSPVKTTKDINLLPAGTYTVAVTDAGGCGTTASATINSPSVIVFNLTFAAGFNAIFTTTGGTPGYLYNRTGMSSSLFLPASDAIFTGLPANTSYIFKVKDANGCQKSVIKKTPAAMAPTGGTKQQQAADRSETEILTEGIFLFPNPADELITLEWLDEENAAAGNIFISDAAGRIIRQQPARVASEAPLQIRLDNLSAGFYNLTFKTDSGRTHTQRFVIAKN